MAEEFSAARQQPNTPTTVLSRNQLVNRAIGARTLIEIRELREQIAAFLRDQPGDAGLRELDTHLERVGAALGKQSEESFAYLTTVKR